MRHAAGRNWRRVLPLIEPPVLDKFLFLPKT